MHKSKKISVIILLAILLSNVSLRIIYTPNNPISWDTFGYYLYLPTTFIYDDLGLEKKDVIEDIITKYKSTSTFYQVSKSKNGSWVMKYSMGMAIFYSPAFFAGHAAANLFDYPTDGFSKPYQLALIVNGILFFFLGLFFLRKLLLQFFSDVNTGIVLLLIFFGTNYLWYSTFSAEMPHNYIFTAYAFILWQTIMWHKSHKRSNIILLAIAIGFTTLARPTEIIALIIPLLWGVYDKKSLIKRIKLFHYYKSQLILFGIIIAVIGSFQIVYWRIYSGDFIYYSYVNPGEGFEFLWPYTLKVLFSFRKGWLIYTPILAFALIGFISLYKKNKGVFYPVFIFFIINLYIVSSWSCWWYAQSFGQRALVQSYAVLAIPFGYFITDILKKSKRIKAIITVLLLFFVLLNIFQSWQYTKGIFSGDRMTPQYYFKSFGTTKHIHDADKYLLIDRTFKGAEKIPNNINFKHSVLRVIDFETVDDSKQKYQSSKFVKNGSYSFKMDSTLQFAPGYKIKYNELTDQNYAWIRVSLWVYPAYPLSENNAILVVSFQHKGGNYKYRGLNLLSPHIVNNLKPNEWNKVSIDYLTPEVRSENDNLVVYIWNRGKKNIYFDDLTIEVFEPINE